MMLPGIVSYLLIAINVITTYRGLSSALIMHRYAFDVDAVLMHKDYKRLVTSGFLHVSWMHLFFNMLTLYLFGPDLEVLFGVGGFLVIYFASMVGGNLLSLYIHRHHGNYTSVGASGALSGIVLAYIAVSPGAELGLFGLPAVIPAWLYGVLYILYSIYGVESGHGNIGHSAHLGGSIFGLVLAVCFMPGILRVNYLPIAGMLAPAVIFIYMLLTKPGYLVFNPFERNTKGFRTLDDKYNEGRAAREKELNLLLEKISRQGFNSLTDYEKARLKALSGDN